MINVIKGDLIDLAKQGKFDVIGHGVNCFCRQKSGLAKQMVENFQTNDPQKYTLEHENYNGDIKKLGNIQFHVKQVRISNTNSGYIFNVINCYTQYYYGYDENTLYVDYEAVALCFKKINHIFKGKEVGLPWIGCGLANGNKEVINHLMIAYLKDVNLTIVEYQN